MHINDYDYNLPEELIAKRPLTERDGCRLLCLGRDDGAVSHLAFRDILGLLRSGDRLVFNDTRVIPARVFCRKDTGAAVELLFTERMDDGRWLALVKPGKRAPVGTSLFIDGHPNIKICIDGIADSGFERVIKLAACVTCTSIDNVIGRYGHIPLPHYMNRGDEEFDRERYQTVYAAAPGAVAAPTAGLHFTDALLDELSSRGIQKTFVTLHVGIGTFRPVKTEDPRDHDMHEERFELSEQAADEINKTWAQGGRVVAVGTTVVRTLESCAAAYHKVVPKSSRTKVMIYPPYGFKAVDALITNFHLPKSTLLMLVSAFASREFVISAYKEAIKERYRFFSYGDAMMIA